MADVNRSIRKRPRHGATTDDVRTDTGSIAARVAWVLGVLTLAFAIFVGLKYVFVDDDKEPASSPTETPSSSPTVAPSDTPPLPEAAPFDGTWTGHVTGDLNTYDIEVVIVDNGTTLTGAVTYTWSPPRPGVDDCSGSWTQTARRDDHVEIRETITSGDACIGEVDITLDLRTNGTIAFAIDYSDVYHPRATLVSEG